MKIKFDTTAQKFYVENEEGRMSEGNSPLEAAAYAADEIAQPGSYYWHMAIAGMLMESNEYVINTYGNPFESQKGETPC